MNPLWDYDSEELQKTPSGRIKILERNINFGTRNEGKISRSEVKQNWDKLQLFPLQKRLFELLIWGKKC
jgi:hypothetical protein